MTAMIKSICQDCANGSGRAARAHAVFAIDLITQQIITMQGTCGWCGETKTVASYSLQEGIEESFSPHYVPFRQLLEARYHDVLEEKR